MDIKEREKGAKQKGTDSVPQIIVIGQKTGQGMIAYVIPRGDFYACS